MNGYTVFKQTGTHSDALAAIGAADVLRHLDPRIVEFGDRFEVRLPSPLAPGDLDGVDPGFSYLEGTAKNRPNLPPERVVNASGASGENRMYAILRRMKAYGGPNKVVVRFARMTREEWTRRVWSSFTGRQDFVFSSPLVQLFNPHSGKGYAMLKPAGTNRADKTKNRWAEPFSERLRFRGYFEGAAAWFTSGDLRLYCPIPADVPYDAFVSVAASFRDLNLGGSAVKMDCRAVLALTRLLIENSDGHRRPAQAVGSMWATHYKDMGQAHAFMAMEQLAVPDWFPLLSNEDRELWLRVLEEHDRALRRLNDSHSDEFAVLKQYRRTFQTRWQPSVAELVEFLADYGALVFKRRSQDQFSLPQLTAAGSAAILHRNPELREILANPGFLAIAAAIRSSTVGAQAARHNGHVDHRQICYGLLSELRRAGGLGVRELWDRMTPFIAGFNREAARRRAARIRSMNIQDAELAAFGSLLDRTRSGVPVASLLCGFSACLPGASAARELEPTAVQSASA
jgi:hypothetical protein